jgi:hypothetical protein
VSGPHGMACPQTAGGDEHMKIAENVLDKLSRKVDKGWSFGFGVRRELRARYKKKHV